MKNYKKILKSLCFFSIILLNLPSNLVQAQITEGETPPPQSEPIVYGTGIVGKIPVWTGEHSISNSVITELNGNIGIGMSMPSNRFEVYTPQSKYYFLDEGLRIINSAGPSILFSDANGEWRIKYITGPPSLQFTFEDMNFLKINYDGYVTIARDLSVGGILSVSESITANDINASIINASSVDVGSKLTAKEVEVSGKILAQEIEVSLTAGGGADYVLANDFKLRSLKELEYFINQNNHLPDTFCKGDGGRWAEC